MKLMQEVKEVKKVSNVDELNKLINEDWILLLAVPSPEGLDFIVGCLGTGI